MQFHLTRADFETLIEDELKAFVSIMKEAFELSGKSKYKININSQIPAEYKVLKYLYHFLDDLQNRESCLPVLFLTSREKKY